MNDSAPAYKKPVFYFLGFLSFLFPYLAYLKTVAPTLSFWDCGEFIAAAKTLAVPHPPGSPLHSLLGRIFVMFLGLFPGHAFADVSYRVNLVSVVSTAAAAFFGYLILVRVITAWYKPGAAAWSHLVPEIGAFAGALMAAFSGTTWFSAVEAEVYSFSLAMYMCTIWLTFKWKDDFDAGRGDRFLYLIIYLCLLGVGIQLYAMYPLPFIFCFIVWHDKRKREDWKMWVCLTFLMSIIMNPHDFLWSDSVVDFVFGPISPLTMIPFGFLLMYTFILWFDEAVDGSLKKGLLYLLAALGCGVWFMMLVMTEGIKLPEDKGGITTFAMLLAAGLGVYCGIRSWSLVSKRWHLMTTAKKEDPAFAELHREKTLLRNLFFSLGIMIVAGLIGAKVEDAINNPGDSLHGLFTSASQFIPLSPGFSVTLLLAALAVLIYNRKNPDFKTRDSWRTVAIIGLVTVIGFSVQFYTPIRSYLDPIIDENNPELVMDGVIPKDVTAFQYYFERKQYGSESMLGRMFHRRGQFLNQIFSHENMGFGSYLVAQLGEYGRFQDLWKGPDKLRALLAGLGYLLPLLLVIWAAMYLLEREKKHVLLMLSLLLAGTLGLVLYMNFADGTVPDWQEMKRYLSAPDRYMKPEPIQMEVRERDYFFSPGMFFFGLWLGMALAALISFLQEEKTRVRYKNALAPLLALFTLVSPLYPFANNLGRCARTDNYVAYDYAYNLLQSCARNSLLFTNGDNDTFPLWTLQEAYGIRKDVRIINLSLGNTDWYNCQLLTTEPKVDLGTGASLEKGLDEIKRMEHQRNNFYEGVRGFRLGNTDIVVDLPGFKELPVIRVQDKLVLRVVQNNYGKRPIYFAVTVSEGNLMGLAPYLTMEGLVFLLDSAKVNALAAIRRVAEKEEARLEEGLQKTGLDKELCRLLARQRGEAALTFRQKADTAQCRKWLDNVNRGLKKNWTPEKQAEVRAAVFAALAAPAAGLDAAQRVFDECRQQEQVVFSRRMNLEKTAFELDHIYRFRGLGRADVYLEDNTRKLLSNYAASFIGYIYEVRNRVSQLAQEQNLRKSDSAAIGAEIARLRAEIYRKLDQAIALLPDDWRIRTLATQIYMDDRNFPPAETVLKQGLLMEPDRYDYNYALGLVYNQEQKRDSAIPLFEKLLNNLEPAFGDPQKQRRESYSALYLLATMYRDKGDKNRARAWVQRWLDKVPQDQNFKRLLAEIDGQKEAPAPGILPGLGAPQRAN